MKQLPFNYDVTVDNMVPMTPIQETDEFKLDNATFLSFANNFDEVKMKVLKFENKQIMQMQDGMFVLEVEVEDYCGYWYSDSLEDLINGSTEINELEDLGKFPNEDEESSDFAEEVDFEELDGSEASFGGLNARFNEEEED